MVEIILFLIIVIIAGLVLANIGKEKPPQKQPGKDVVTKKHMEEFAKLRKKIDRNKK